MNDERQAFSRRLADAMRRSGYEPRPNALMRVFNSRYPGTSVREMTASRWLGGKAIPNQDKLQVLAELFGIEPQELRFGKSSKGRVAEARGAWPPSIGPRERQVITAFLALPAKRRDLVSDLVDVLSETKPSA
jgi:hypothetical protein